MKKAIRVLFTLSIYSLLLGFCCLSTSVLKAQVAGQVWEDAGGLRRLIYPQGASYTTSGSQTGAIKVVLPTDYGDTRIRMRIEVFNYERGESFTAWVAGLMQQSQGKWFRTSAEILTTSENRVLPVRFGHVGTAQERRAAVWIGDENTTWNNVRVHVAEIMVSTGDLAEWQDDWSIDIDAGELDGVVSQDAPIQNVLPLAQREEQSYIWEGTGSPRRLLYPEGATHTTQGSQDGAIKIVLPVDYDNTRLRMRVEVYNYQQGESFTAWLSGLQQSSQGKWFRTSAEIITTSENRVLPVHFGHVMTAQGQRTAVWIGDENTTWSQARIQVAEIMVSGGDQEEWQTGWTIEIDEGDLDGTVSEEFAIKNPLPLAQTPQLVANETNMHTRILYPGGAAYNPRIENLTGAIQVQLPQAPENGTMNGMLRMRIEIYNHRRNTAMSVWVGGYVGNNWNSSSAQIITSTKTQDLPIRFGSAEDAAGNTRSTVWIGEVNTAWTFLNVAVAEVIVGYTDYDLDLWSDGWDISLATSLADPTITIIDSETKNPGDALPIAQTIWQTTSSNDKVYVSDQQVFIGPDAADYTETSDDYFLAVNGDIKAQRIKVSAENWPDYVFTEDFELPTIESVQQYITEHGHLPEVPSKQVAETEGVYLNDMDNIMLQKIEELTLYIIQQNEQMKRLQAELDRLSAEVINQKAASGE